MQEECPVITELFSKSALNFPDKVALQIKRDNHWEKITYKELKEHSLGIAVFLIEEGLKKNDASAIILENRPEWAMIYLGIIYAGITCVPLDVQLSPQEINNLIADSQAKVIFCSLDTFVKKIKQNIESDKIKIILLDAKGPGDKNVVNFSSIGRGQPDKNVMPRALPEDIASLIYTSGTTGLPKGVLLSHTNICSNSKSLIKLNLFSPSDSALSILPLHHTYAFTATLMAPLFIGGTITYCPSLKPEDLKDAIMGAGVTVMVGVPQLFSMLHRQISERVKKISPLFLPFILPLARAKIHRQLGPKLRLMVSGGARLDPGIARDLRKFTGIKIIEGYGLTEASPVVTLNPPKRVKFGSVGKAIPDVQIKIINPDKTGMGQVLIKGPNVMQGYFKHPEWTEAVIKDSWFYSGDLGRIDREGYLYLSGRENDIIVLGSGKNIYPEELEEYYSKSPYIKEICIIAVREERFGRLAEVLHAIVVPDLEYFKQRDEADVRGKVRWELENLANNLPSYQHIMGFTLTKDELPRTALKKIKRYLVKEKYLSGSTLKAQIREPAFTQEESGIIKKDIAKKVIDYISGELRKPVSLDSHLEIDLGIDSLSRVELGLGLEKILNIKIPEDIFYSVSTVKEFIAGISALSDKAITVLPETSRIQVDWREILAQAPKRQSVEKVRIEPYFLDRLVTYIFKVIFTFIFRICWFLRVKGKNNLPSKGPYLLCPNHASYLDGFAIFTGLPFHNIEQAFFLGYGDIFEHPFVRWALKIGRLIPIDPEINLTQALQAVSFALSQKKIVCIFPEGRRSIDENVGEFRKGVGILIKELNIPVVPVYIKGSHRSWPRTTRLPRFYPLKIIFGAPVSAKELLKKKGSTEDDYEAIANNLREEVLRLIC